MWLDWDTCLILNDGTWRNSCRMGSAIYSEASDFRCSCNTCKQLQHVQFPLQALAELETGVLNPRMQRPLLGSMAYAS